MIGRMQIKAEPEVSGVRSRTTERKGKSESLKIAREREREREREVGRERV